MFSLKLFFLLKLFVSYATLLPTLLSLLGRPIVKTVNLDTQNQKFAWFSLLNEVYCLMRFFTFVNDVIIASKICNFLNLDASASAQNILPTKVFRKKQILLTYEVLVFQRYQKLK